MGAAESSFCRRSAAPPRRLQLSIRIFTQAVYCCGKPSDGAIKPGNISLNTLHLSLQSHDPAFIGHHVKV